MGKDYTRAAGSKTGLIFLKGVILGVIVTGAFILLFAAVMLVFETDRALAAPFATVSVAAGTLIAALYAARKIGEKGYLVGLITGLAVFAAITLISLIVSRGSLTVNTLFHLVIILLSSLIGGVLGVNRGKNRKYI